MSTHRFTVNVPNPTQRTVVSELRIERAKLGNRLPLDLPQAQLEVVGAGLALDPCAPGKRTMSVRLRPNASVDVHITVTTADPPRRTRGGTAMVNLVDRRHGKVVGGVLLACVDRPGLESPGRNVSTPKPCPVTLATTIYWVRRGADPSKRPTRKSLPLGATFSLVVPLTNPKARSLDGVTVYLEHLGISGTSFVPASWNIGRMRRSDVFYATWDVNTDNSRAGLFNASIVVESEGLDRTRLVCPLSFRQARIEAIEKERDRDRRRAR